MQNLIYKYLPPFYGNKSKDLLPFFDSGCLSFTSVWALNDVCECAVFDAQSAAQKRYPLTSGILEAYRNIRRNSFSNDLKEQLKIRFAVLSFCANPTSPVMWSHYTLNHKGVCLAFDLNHSFFKGSDKWLSSISPVRYRTERPVYDENNLHELVLTKGIDWSYEQEMRMLLDVHEMPSTRHHPYGISVKEVVVTDKATPDINFSGISNWLVSVPLDALSEVVLGINADKSVCDFVTGKARMLGIPVYQASASASRFEISRGKLL